MDPTLPFYYSTSAHHRFYEGEMPAFDENPQKKERPQCVPRRELAGSTGRRVTLPVRGSLSVRAEFHNVPVSLPPLPNASATMRIMQECSCYI